MGCSFYFFYGFSKLSQVLVRVHSIRHVCSGMPEDPAFRIFVDFGIVHERSKSMTAIMRCMFLAVDSLHH